MIISINRIVIIVGLFLDGPRNVFATASSIDTESGMELCDQHLNAVHEHVPDLANKLYRYTSSRVENVPEMACKLGHMASFISTEKPKTSAFILKIVRGEIDKISSFRLDKFNLWRQMNYRFNPLILLLDLSRSSPEISDDQLVDLVTKLDRLDPDTKESIEKTIRTCRDSTTCLRDIMSKT